MVQEVSEEFMLGIERLAELQRKRLEELQEGQAALDAAVQALRRGQPHQAQEALKNQLNDRAEGPTEDAVPVTVAEAYSARASAPLQRNHSAPALVVKDLPRQPRFAWQEDPGLDMTPDLKETPKDKPKRGFIPVWGSQAGLESLTPPKILQHHIQGGSAEGDAPGMHGHCKDQDVQDGIERGIGNGRRYIGTQSHFVQNAVTQSDGPTAHGNVKDLTQHLGRQKRTVQVPSQIFAGVGDAGDDIPFGEMGWLGAGRRHYAVKENIVGGVSEDQITPSRRLPGRPPRDHVHGGSGIDTPPESEVRYGRQREAAFQEGLERYIGHGRRHCPEWRQEDQIFRAHPEPVESPAHSRPVGGADHIVRAHGQATCAEDTSSEQGKRHFGTKDRIGLGISVLPSDGKEDFVQGLPRGIGQGKQRISEKEHLMGALRRTEDQPGNHGHSRDDDFQDGLERGIGHGKRRLASGFEAVKAEAMVTCSRCGHTFEEDARVCRNCGQKRGEVIPTPHRSACSTPKACDDTPAAGVFSRPKMW